MCMPERLGGMVAAHSDGVPICRRSDIQVQVAIPKMTIADCLQAGTLLRIMPTDDVVHQPAALMAARLCCRSLCIAEVVVNLYRSTAVH
jgi:hypothetical protein